MLELTSGKGKELCSSGLPPCRFQFFLNQSLFTYLICMMSYWSAAYIKSDTIPILGLPLPRLLSIFPSKMSLSMLSSIKICSIQFLFCRLQIVFFLKFLFSFTLTSTFSLAILYFFIDAPAPPSNLFHSPPQPRSQNPNLAFCSQYPTALRQCTRGFRCANLDLFGVVSITRVNITIFPKARKQ